METSQKRVLILVPFYYPGFKYGGPQQTVRNICRAFHDKADIYVLTRNHDREERKEYALEHGKWLDVEGVHVKYLKENRYHLPEFLKAYKSFDDIYACVLFAKNTYITMLVHKLLHMDKKLYVAPMGVFSNDALARRSFKKKVFLTVYKTLHMYKDIIWSFTSEGEKKDTEGILGNELVGQYIIAEDLPKFSDFDSVIKSLKKKDKNQLELVFLSRVHPHKNLIQCIEILNTAFDGKIKFDIYGIAEDEAYLSKCINEIGKLPENVECRYRGEAKPDEVEEILLRHDALILPTKSENYGHVIYEALAAGCIPIISDRTPWQELDKEDCGRVVKADDIAGYRKAIKELLNMSHEDYINMKERAVEYAERKYTETSERTGYREVFVG